jgi:BolA protein
MRKVERIEVLLGEHLAPLVLQVEDESHRHSKGLETHFKVVVVSERFVGANALARHRAVHAALSELLAPKLIHALSIHAHSPDEWIASGGSVPASPSCLGGSKADKS